MRRALKYFALSFSIILVISSLVLSDITIHNNLDSVDSRSWGTSSGLTRFNIGESTGKILNAHYLPGMLDYARGNYSSALKEMDYCLDRPEYIQVNPRGSQYISAAHYLRGMIYVYHASGDERYAKAKYDFEQAIQWDQNNHYAYLELVRIYVAVGSTVQASTVLQQLLKANPPEALVQQVRQQLTKLKPESTTKRSDKQSAQVSQSRK